MSAEKVMERLPEPIRQFAEAHGEVAVNEMPDEGIRWGVHVGSGHTKIHIHEFSDEDGTDHTVDFYVGDRRLFGYTHPESFKVMDVRESALNVENPRTPVFQFEFETSHTATVTLGIATDGKPAFHMKY